MLDRFRNPTTRTKFCIKSLGYKYFCIPILDITNMILFFSGVDLRGHPLCVLDLRLLLHPVLFDWSVTELRQEVQDSHRLPRVRVPGDGLRKVYGQSTGRCSVNYN